MPLLAIGPVRVQWLIRRPLAGDSTLASRWREQRAGSVCLELPEGINLPSRYPGVTRYSHPDTFSGSTSSI